MADIPDNGPDTDQPVPYTETVVEYVDNRRQRTLLAIVFVVLFLLLIGTAWAVIRLTPGTGAPVGTSSLPTGIKWVRSIYGWGSGAGESLVAPTDVAIAKDGTIWAISAHSVIAGFNPDGSSKTVIKPEKTASLEGIAVGDDGNLYVTDFGGQVVEFSPEGKLLDTWKVELPNEVDARDGKIAVAAGPGIAVFTHDDSKVLLQIGGARGWGKDQFDLPHGIVLAEDGRIYVSDTQNRRVKAFSAEGRLLWTLGEAPDRSRPGVADVRSEDASITKGPFLLPSGMTMDANGRLVVVDPFRFRIVVIDPKTGKIAREGGAGTRQAIYGDYGQSDGLFAYPTGIAYDKTRDWFAVADTYNNRIQIIRLPGSGGSALAPVIGGFTLPMCVLCLPFILLLLAVLALMMKRRRAVGAEEGAPAAGTV